MLDRRRMIIWSLISIVAAASATIAIEKAQPRLGAANHLSVNNTASPVAIPVNQAPPPKVRNLSLQPEAFNVGRRLGQRFAPGKREKSVLVGTLTIGSERHIVQTTRSQTDQGEQVEIKIAGSSGSLTWESGQGALVSNNRANGSDRELIERFVLDSPDQFVLAQLRGAGYHTVARNVRPEGVSEDYAGPLWNMVRVDDLEQDAERRPQSLWRLYYINTATGLIDKIVCQFQGQTIEAVLSGWADQNGEQVPSQITWTRQGQTLMQYRLTNFSHSGQQQ